LKELIRHILQENTREIPNEVISQELNGLIHKKIRRYPHSFFMVDENNVINIELDKHGFLWVSNALLKRLSNKLSLSSEVIKKILKNWIIDNYKSSDSLSESMSPHVKRRLTDSEILDEITAIMDYDLDISLFDSASDCIEEVCDTLNEKFLDYLKDETSRQVSLKEKDELYWYFVNRFGKYIEKQYESAKAK
jgi:hypothetical protein